MLAILPIGIVSAALHQGGENDKVFEAVIGRLRGGLPDVVATP